MTDDRPVILVLNAGSSSLKFCVYRIADAETWRLEARGDIRGGRFVAGISGEQFALPEAATRLREVRRHPDDDSPLVISARDPLNLTGILDAGERVPAKAGARIAYRNGIAVAVLEGEYLRPLVPLDEAAAVGVVAHLTGSMRIRGTEGFVGRPRVALGVTAR